MLVREAGTADAIVQQTWLRALERRPRRGEGLCAWLHTLLRNEARHGKSFDVSNIVQEFINKARQ